jgi:prenyltransferase beta subunit
MAPISGLARRAVAAALAAGLTGLAAASGASPAAADSGPTPAEKAAEWVAHEVDAGRYSFDRLPELLLGMIAVETAAREEADVSAIASTVDATTDLIAQMSTVMERFLDRTAPNARSLLAFLATGTPTTFVDGSLQEQDLVESLLQRQCVDPLADFCDLPADVDLGVGRFSDRKDPDHTNVMSQALAILATKRVLASVERDDPGAEKPDVDGSVSFLLKSQCRDGGFPPTFTKGGWQTYTTRRPAAAASCDPDPGTTAVAVQALVQLESTCTQAEAAATWLVKAQLPGGGWAETAGGETANAITTSLALQALAASGWEDQARAKGRAFLESLQKPDSGAYEGPDGTLDPVTTAYAAQALADISLVTLAKDDPAPQLLDCADPGSTVPPVTTDPTPAQPDPTDGEPTSPEPTKPEPTEPEPTKPGPTDAEPTDPVTLQPRPAPPVASPVGTDLTDGGTELARTGSTSWPVAGAGLILVATGFGLVGASRRRRLDA